jgi:(heptosyl)LPS beta-1,4-glucosyltransferase
LRFDDEGVSVAAMPPISVVICCFNARAMVEAACRSAAWADELVVVDSGSTDGTQDVARQFAHRFAVEPFRGFSRQKQFAVDLARNDWVLVLDHDEEITPALAGELSALKDRTLDDVDLFLCRRRNFVMGRVVRTWWPDWQSRLFHRRRIVWNNDLLNDGRLASDPKRVRRFKGCLDHNRLNDAGFLAYYNPGPAYQRTILAAAELHRRGRRAHFADLAFRPAAAFLKHYLIRRGVLDGTFGLMMAQRAALAVQLKYAALWAYDHGFLKHDDPEPPK